MSVDHYENFPVASFLLPARLRPPVQAIYAFARSADDIADEGDTKPEHRLQKLENYTRCLQALSEQRAVSTNAKMFNALNEAIINWHLPMQPFHDLLSAFKQDVLTTRYQDYALLTDYCRRSANPVGRLMLHLYQTPSPANLQASDAICTALQIINFLQDVAIDWQKNRIYIPQEDLQSFRVDEAQIAASKVDANWRALMAFQVQRVRSLMWHGAPLALRLPGRIGLELRMVVQGGLRILERIERVNYDVFVHRPVLGMTDWIVIAWRALRMAKTIKAH